MEIGGAAVAVPFDEGRAPLAGVVAGGAFDLDHIGAEIGQRLPSPWSGEDAGKFQHPYPVEWCGHPSMSASSPSSVSAKAE